MVAWRAILAVAVTLGVPGIARASATASPTPSPISTIVPSPEPDGTVVVVLSVIGKGKVTSVPSGIACPPQCLATFVPGTQVVFKAGTLRNWNLRGWGGLCAGKRKTCVVTLPAATQPIPIRARFTLNHRVFTFWPRVLNYIATRADRVGVAVYDARTRTWFLSNADAQFHTASTVKAQILGTMLARAQAEGRDLTSWETSNTIPMIEQSDNAAATRLWNSVGGSSGVHRFDESIGMSETDPQWAWGLTLVSARDSVTLMRNFLYRSARLSDHYRDIALGFLENVVPYQRWGISAGVNNAAVAIKNGWLPHGNGWIINSIGGVWGAGRSYAIAVLTDGNPSEEYGIRTIEGISRIVWSGLHP